MSILGKIFKPLVSVANVATLGLAKPLLQAAAPIVGGALGAAGGPLGTAIGSAVATTVVDQALSGDKSSSGSV
jgi:hypothetical protein